ncbi:hypothetical protein SRHO_G00164980 [Serrasalmus rhombeus]
MPRTNTGVPLFYIIPPSLQYSSLQLRVHGSKPAERAAYPEEAWPHTGAENVDAGLHVPTALDLNKPLSVENSSPAQFVLISTNAVGDLGPHP